MRVAVGAVDRERPAQDEVGAGRDAQVHELPGLHARGAARGVQREQPDALGEAVVARARVTRSSAGCRRAASRRAAPASRTASSASKSCSAQTSRRPSLTASIAWTIAAAAGSVVMLVMPWLDRRRADVVAVGARLLAERRVDDELHLAVRDRVDDVRPALVHLEHLGDRDARRAQRLGGARAST